MCTSHGPILVHILSPLIVHFMWKEKLRRAVHFFTFYLALAQKQHLQKVKTIEYKNGSKKLNINTKCFFVCFLKLHQIAINYDHHMSL